MSAQFGKLERLLGIKAPVAEGPEQRQRSKAWRDVGSLYADYLANPMTRKNALVYFIQCPGNRIKIGYSFNPKKRMRDLQVSMPFRLTLLGHVPGCVVLEKMLHARFASKRVGGEWFKATKSLMRDVNALIDSHGVREHGGGNVAS